MPAVPEVEAASELPPHLKDLYDHVVYVLDRHLALTRPTPLTGDLIDATLSSFEALQALVAPMRLPQYDVQTPQGRLMDSIGRLNQQMPGVALRTLWNLHEYLSTSDDDGIRTRERALGIIENIGLPDECGGSSGKSRKSLLRAFPPLP